MIARRSRSSKRCRPRVSCASHARLLTSPCVDWSLLSADLQFIYLDPILAAHLEGQATAFVGQSLLSFVHPDERDTAKQDLSNVLNSKTMHGSVTRVRFARLSKVRRDLGLRGPAHNWSEADKIALDSEYMAVEIVINWAADGLVLCFIHATVDLSPSDNDEERKTVWTNWCGTPYMQRDQIDLLFNRLLMCIPQTGTLHRVFQILANDSEKKLLMSWPPDPSQLTDGGAQDFANLVDTVNMGTGLSGPNEAKTSCTRRFKALHDIPSFGGEVESIFIPHGSIIFACHKVNPSSRGPVNSTPGMQQVAFASSGYNSQVGSGYYDPSPYTLPPISTQQPYAYMPQHNQGPLYSPERWTQGVSSSMNNMRSSANSYVQAHSQEQVWQASTPQSSPIDPSAPVGNGNRGDSPSYLYSPATTASSISPITTDIVPPPRRRVSPTTKEVRTNTRNHSNRPAGITKCMSCEITSSPEWRKGPSGKKELCNACGLRFARQKAKKEGHGQNQRRPRKSSGGIVKRDASNPYGPTSPTYGGLRRICVPDSSFNSTSDIYSQATPSPSPPGSHLNFMHYTDSRTPYTSASSANYYPASTNSTASHPNDPHLPSLTSSHQSLPHLPPISQYGERLQAAPASSPLTLSSIAATMPAASYERDRDRDREYRDLSQVSSESRLKRAVMSQQ